MKAIILTCLMAALNCFSFAQAPASGSNQYPTKLENLLRRTGVVVTSTSVEAGSIDGTMSRADTNTVTLTVRAQSIANEETKIREYGLTLQLGRPHEWRTQTTYVDYEEIDRLLAAIDRLILLKPELPLVQARYETRGGLIVSTYSTEHRDVLCRIQLSVDETFWLQTNLDALRDFRSLLVTAKATLDAAKSPK